MSTETLKMPKHSVPVGNEDGGDFWHATDGTICRSWRIPGYAHMNPDGTLHCNRCGWVTPEPVVTALSSSGKTYLTWDELVEAEANGYVVVGVSSRPGDVPAVYGPWDSKKDAHNARARLRRKWAKEMDKSLFKTYVRVLWPED